MLRKMLLPLLALGVVTLTAAFAVVVLAQDGAPALPSEPDSSAVLDYILQENPYLTWGTWPDLDFAGFLPSGDPHGATVRIFVNEIARDVALSDSFDGMMPVGSIIVKENYPGQTNTPEGLAALTVVVKLEDFNEEGNGWYWLKSSGENMRTIDAEGAVMGCMECHSQEGNHDYILRYGFGEAPAVTPEPSPAAPMETPESGG